MDENMRIVVAGSSGLVGKRLTELLSSSGHDVVRLVRGNASDGQIQWDPSGGELDGAKLEGVDAIVHLGGESIAEGRWNPMKKRRIRDSRVDSTTLLSNTIASLNTKPQVFLCASAIGYYGSRGDEELVESSSGGSDFLAGVCQEWESATEPASAAGTRVVNLRTGVVLDPGGGALSKILTPFKMGAGGIVGNGKQYWSCIALNELTSVIKFCLETSSISGPVNGVCPEPTTNKVFTKTLGSILGRPTIFPLPAFVAKLMLGEMAEALLLASARVVPKKLADANYQFKFADLESSLRDALGK